MLDPIVAFFQRIFAAIGRGIGLVIAWILWPFITATNWYKARSWIIKGPIGIGLLLLVGFYAYFIWQTQVWSGFNPDYVNSYNLAQRKQDAGGATSGGAATTSAAGDAAEPEPKTCVRSAIVDVTADLIDFNVNQNAWISSMLLYKVGLFGVEWDKTPWMDNKAAFQRGVNQTIRRTAVELVDALGRVRGTSGINADLQRARGNMQFDEETWYFGSDSLLPKTPTPNYYRTAMADLRKFNASLEACDAIFDGRSDNLIEFLDRIANDIGSTSAIIRERSEFHNGGWFDTRADDRFWFAFGQLYGYYGILSAAGADFDAVIKARGIEPLWIETMKQLRSALKIQPAIISNGREDGWIMPTHLATMGFYILRVRSNLVEMRDVLAR
ncbi:DUF2333 family protein [Shinella curvata]|uniref:DUF2333 family protein n=1 Tax=Shinella curvata TaxID=1817964 RepID=A0ABT8XJ57_9HYPH|nr:DUF2333 family protein [Shinella curvata]MCJ8052683.1 DUF2333 family protein [Shinella curvata]MDO6123763.1 DUF2333 family protein [Shinella curvata]